MSIDLDTETLKLFAEIGFLGLSQGNPAAAEAIFSMYCQHRPGAEVGAVGAAMAALAAQRPDLALQRLNAAEQTQAVLAFTAVANGALGDRAAALELAEDLADMGSEPALIAIARAAAA